MARAACLQACGSGQAARGAALLRALAGKLGQHQRALKAHSADAPCFSFSSLPPG